MGIGLLLLLQGTDASKRHHPGLNAFGRAALDYVDEQTLGLSIIAVVIVLWVVGRLFTKRWAGVEELFHAGVAILAAASGATVAIVFLFTDPPAFDKLTGEARWIPAAVTFAFTIRHCLQQIGKSFFKPCNSHRKWTEGRCIVYI